MHRIITKLLVALLLVTTAGTAAAQAGVEDTLRGLGLTILGDRTEGGIPTWDLADDQGREFAISVLGSFSESRQRALLALRDVVLGIDGLDIQRVRFVFELDRADAIVIPDRFTRGDIDFAEYMPSGMQFQFDDAVGFDFRMLIQNLAVRINGQFLSQEQFLDRLDRAVENPAAYILSQDPQFLARRIDDQLGRIEALEFGAAEASASTAQEIERLTEANAVLKQELDLLRQGAAILFSRGAFGGPKVVATETVLAAVELRASEPDLSQAELLSRINGSLAEGETGLHARHIQAIDGMYFNKFE